MRRFTIKYLALIIALALLTACPCHAAPAVKTIPRIFPLHFVSWFKSGPVVPQVAMKANFVAYSGLPSYKQFLDAPENSPERAVVRYVQVLAEGGTSLTPEALNSAKGLYTEDERKNSDKIVTKQIRNDSEAIISMSDVRMWHRYDVGQLSIITLGVIMPKRFQPYIAIYLRKSGSSYFITTYGNGSRREDIKAPFNWIIALNESHMVARPNLGEGFQATYQYRLPLHSSLPGDTSGPWIAPPLKIMFNGKVSDVLIDEKTVAADATQTFVKHAIQTFRKGTLQEFLGLWTEYDYIHVFKPELQEQTGAKVGQILPYDLQKNWNQVQVHLVFTIDYEFGALVFLRTSDSKKLHMLNVWKQAPDDYRLSEKGGLTSGELTLPGNLNYLFDSDQFQNYLNGQVDQFIQQTDAKKATAQPVVK